MAITKLDLTKAMSGTLPRANGGSDLVLLDSGSGSTAVATVDIDSTYINSTYDDYFIIFNARPVTDAVLLYAKFSVNGSFITANYDYGASELTTASDFITNNNTTEMRLHGYSQGNASTEKLQAQMKLSNVNSSTYRANLSGTVNGDNPSGTVRGASFIATYTGDDTASIDGIRFGFTSGNIANYDYRIWGVKS